MSFRNEFTIDSFFARLHQESKLFGILCKKCGLKMVPPRPLCSRCLSSELEWFEVPKEGELVAFSEIHVTNDSFREFVPYIVGIVRFEDGLKIPGIIKNSEIKELHVGTRVRIETLPHSDVGSSAGEGKIAFWFRRNER